MISGYRLMWLLVMFDLPVETKENRRDYRRFVDKLEDDGYSRVQYSIYVRPCATDENTLVHQSRIIEAIPPEGEVRVMKFTDKQWGRMLVYRSRSLRDAEKPPDQFSFFDEDGAPLIGEENSTEVDYRTRVSVLETKAPYSQPREGDAVNETVEATPTVSAAEQAISSALLKLTGQAASRRKRSRKSKPEQTPGFDFFD
jgi:CRISPR-associated protein Cas2